MDEPFGALDEIVRDHLNEQLLRLWDQTGKTVVFVTHSIPEAVFLSSKIVVMSPRPGRIIDVIPCDFPHERTLEIRRTPEFLKIAQRVRLGLRFEGIPMTSSDLPVASDKGPAVAPPRWRSPSWLSDLVPVLVILLVLVVIWYVAAVLMNMALVRDAFEREETTYTLADLVAGTLGAERPLVPAPHQIVLQFVDLGLRLPAGLAAQPALSWLGHAVGDAHRIPDRRRVRHPALGADRAPTHA